MSRLLVHKDEFSMYAARWLKNLLSEMIEFFDTENTFELRGVSLFIVMDHETKNFRAVLIDLTSFEDTGVKDEGFVYGLMKLKSMIGDIANNWAQAPGAIDFEPGTTNKGIGTY